MSHGRSMHRALVRHRARLRTQRGQAHRVYLIRRRGECERKKRYDTRAFAESVARKCEAERGVKLEVYDCPHCLGLHLTHLTKAGAA